MSVITLCGRIIVASKCIIVDFKISIIVIILVAVMYIKAI